ncbi:hypothetical protein ACTXG6_45770 [Pseudonocardia sp. Cha107L01]|uniref:hypothetical protein n=1 Tax=Pseudonocardia sp. Cha107L01 TaxID=3457576 RepID=UPI00403E9A20
MSSHQGQPGTVDDLLADASGAGHSVSLRLVRDWGHLGLLDRPSRRPAGRHGSRKALYSANQRGLFLTLLHHRTRAASVRALAQVPIYLWLYWGDDYVPTRQARRAVGTWFGRDHKTGQVNIRAGLAASRATARTWLPPLNHPHATAAARRELVDVVARIANTGNTDPGLEMAIRAVFEPDLSRIERVLGPPEASLTVERMVDTINVRLIAAQRIKQDRISIGLLEEARRSLGIYAPSGLVLPVTRNLAGLEIVEWNLNKCAQDLLTKLGELIRDQPNA